jgi:Short C-terminal domain
MRPGGAIANGFIKFTIPGSPESRGGLSDASKDESAVLFTRKHQAEFDAVREHVENYITARHTAPAQATAAPDLTEQLQRLGELHRTGVLSDEEFASAKANLLRQG